MGESAVMVSHIYSATDNGQRFEVSRRGSSQPGLIALAIEPAAGKGQMVCGEVDRRELNKARFTGRAMKIAEDLSVQYRVISNGFSAQIGFLFGFKQGAESRSLFIDQDSLGWLLSEDES